MIILKSKCLNVKFHIKSKDNALNSDDFNSKWDIFCIKDLIRALCRFVSSRDCINTFTLITSLD